MSVFPKQRPALVIASVGLFVLVAFWLVLNRLRVYFYNFHGTPQNPY